MGTSLQVDEVYKRLAKLTLLVVVLFLFVYLSAGPLSLMFFECRGSNAGTSAGMSDAVLCEMYRRFFVLEILASERAGQLLLSSAKFLGTVFLLAHLAVRARLHRLAILVREVSVILIASIFVLWVCRYDAIRTLRISDFERQKQTGVMKDLNFEFVCPSDDIRLLCKGLVWLAQKPGD